MKIFFILLTSFLLGSSLQAYAKKIVIGSFSSESNAKALVKKMPDTFVNYAELQTLLKKDDAVIHVRKNDKYYLVLVEIFSDKNILKKSFKIIKSKFKNAYINDAPDEKYMLQKAIKIQKLKEQMNKLKTEIKVKKEHIKKVKIVKIQIPRVKKKVEKVNEEKPFLEYINFTFLIVFIIVMSIIYFLVGLKSKYDEY